MDPLHPRAAPDLVGHENARKEFLTSFRSGRAPHAWMVAGPKGIGKATWAYHAASWVLAGQPEAGFPLPADHPVRRRVVSGGHADLFFVEKDPDSTTFIPVERVRKLRSFFSMTAAEGGWRVAVVDAVDELNRHGANAVLKVVEEPPDRALVLLIAHAPAVVLPTVRSRCRALHLAPLGDEESRKVLERVIPELDVETRSGLARLTGGVPGAVLRYADAEGLALYTTINDWCGKLPDLDRPALHAFGERFQRLPGSAHLPVFLEVFGIWVRRASVRLVSGSERVGPDIVAEEGKAQETFGHRAGLAGVLALWDDTRRIAGQTLGSRLDPMQAVLDVLLAAQQAARRSRP